MDKRLITDKNEKKNITHAYREKKTKFGNPIDVLGVHLSRGEWNAQVWMIDNQIREIHRESPKYPGITQSYLIRSTTAFL